MDNFKIAELIFLELKGELSEPEQNLLDAWKSESDENLKLYQLISDEQNIAKAMDDYDRADKMQAWNRLNKQLEKQSPVRRLPFRNLLRYSAAILILIGIGSYLLLKQTPQQTKIATNNILVETGTKKATLTTSNNEKIELGAIQNSRTIKLINTTVIDSNNTLSFDEIRKVKPNETPQISMNTLETPRGGEYSLVLSDGTVVYLNAETKLIFPDFFSNDRREVILYGEAFFEVTKSKNRPFIVKTINYDVKVYGTSFNISSYSTDGFSHTTLVEGSVGIETSSGSSILLKPGEQALFHTTASTFETKQVNTYVYTAWKDGKFVFDHESLKGLTKKLERWYNVNFSFENEEIQAIHFSGTIDRYNDLSDILNIVALTTHIEFEKKGNEVSVHAKKIN